MNYELEIYKLIMIPDEDNPDISYVEEFGWNSDTEFCVWINNALFADFMERIREIFGTNAFDEGGISAKIGCDYVVFDLGDITDMYGVDLEKVFPKSKYKH